MRTKINPGNEPANNATLLTNYRNELNKFSKRLGTTFYADLGKVCAALEQTTIWGLNQYFTQEIDNFEQRLAQDVYPGDSTVMKAHRNFSVNVLCFTFFDLRAQLIFNDDIPATEQLARFKKGFCYHLLAHAPFTSKDTMLLALAAIDRVFKARERSFTYNNPSQLIADFRTDMFARYELKHGSENTFARIHHLIDIFAKNLTDIIRGFWQSAENAANQHTKKALHQFIPAVTKRQLLCWQRLYQSRLIASRDLEIKKPCIKRIELLGTKQNPSLTFAWQQNGMLPPTSNSLTTVVDDHNVTRVSRVVTFTEPVLRFATQLLSYQRQVLIVHLNDQTVFGGTLEKGWGYLPTDILLNTNLTHALYGSSDTRFISGPSDANNQEQIDCQTYGPGSYLTSTLYSTQGLLINPVTQVNDINTGQALVGDRPQFPVLYLPRLNPQDKQQRRNNTFKALGDTDRVRYYNALFRQWQLIIATATQLYASLDKNAPMPRIIVTGFTFQPIPGVCEDTLEHADMISNALSDLLEEPRYRHAVPLIALHIPNNLSARVALMTRFSNRFAQVASITRTTAHKLRDIIANDEDAKSEFVKLLRDNIDDSDNLFEVLALRCGELTAQEKQLLKGYQQQLSTIKNSDKVAIDRFRRELFSNAKLTPLLHFFLPSICLPGLSARKINNFKQALSKSLPRGKGAVPHAYSSDPIPNYCDLIMRAISEPKLSCLLCYCTTEQLAMYVERCLIWIVLKELDPGSDLRQDCTDDSLLTFPEQEKELKVSNLGYSLFMKAYKKAIIDQKAEHLKKACSYVHNKT